ncbi:MAG TPA: DNA polymerase I [Candidatus Pelethousia gallinarum]|nr:DNA polymerase I [Candidatus Pelethousia gallinarum]
MKTLIAIDGNSLMHRAYYALPSMAAKDGTPTGAIFGFLRMLLKLLERQPDYLVVAFDMKGPTFRHGEYGEYKAGRRPTPPDLGPQFPLLRQVLEAMGIAICQCEGYEADDILGTASRMAEAAGSDALLVTGDRDALQLITPHTHVLMTKKGITETVEYDEEALLAAYGLTPERMVDLKGLMGDASDNIPGVPGVGEKTALKLLEKYGTLENTLAHAGEEKGALRTKLEQGAALARLSYRLGKIDTAAPLQAELSQWAFRPQALAGGLPLLYKLELRGIAGQLSDTKPEGEAPAEPTAQTQRVAEEAALEAMVKALLGKSPLGIQLEESCLYVAADPAMQYQVALDGGDLLTPGLTPEQALGAIRPLLEDPGVEKRLFDAKGLLHAIAPYGVRLVGPWQDAMIQDYLLHAIHPADSLKTLLSERNLPYGAGGLLQAGQDMEAELREKGLLDLYNQVELPLVEVLYQMEREGFMVDGAMLRELSELFARRLEEIQQGIYQQAGESFNILSTKQLGVILFEKLGLPTRKKTKTGYSTDSSVLESLQDHHPIVPLVMEYRFLSKLKSTFLDGLLALMQPDGRVHTSFNQNVTATGRISSTEPNLQNIPVRTELGREIRRAFVASPGRVLVGADYSQIELRLLAHMSGDTAMVEAFRTGADIHAITAGEVFGVSPETVTSQQRSAAKAVNFGIVYGISDFGLARNIGVSRKEAGDYIQRYFQRYPGVKAFMDRCVQEGREKGYATTLLGRRRELPELASSNFNTRSFGERVAMNMPIQGTAADIIKLAMVRVYQALEREGLQAKLVLQIHDELILDTPMEEAERVKPLLKACMEEAMPLSVPLIADVREGHSWYDTK